MITRPDDGHRDDAERAACGCLALPTCTACGKPKRWYRALSTLSGRCAKCVARGLR